MEQGKAGGTFLSSSFISLLLPLLMLFIIYYRLTRKRLYELASKIPGPKGYPIIGNALEFIGSPNDVFQRIYGRSKEFKYVARMWIGPRLLVFLTNPKDVEVLLSSSVHIDKSSDYDFFKPWLGNGLLISSGDKWRAHRKLIAPTFHLNVLKSFLDMFNANSTQLVHRLKKEIGKEFDIHDYMSQCTVDTLMETVMGIDKTTQGDEKCGFDYAMAVMKVCDILHIRHTKLWLRPNFIFNLSKYSKQQAVQLNKIHSFTKNVLKQKKENIKFQNNTIHPIEETKINPVEKKIKSSSNDNKSTNEKQVNEGKFSFGQSSGLKDDLDVDEVDYVLGEKKRMAFLDLMIECAQNGNFITDEEIKEQVDTIMFEGHDTTAAATSFFMCVMGCRPEIQEKCLQEMDVIFGDSDRECKFEDTAEMKYLERCIMETLRMFPPVPIISRQIQEEMKLASCDLLVPAKTTVVVGTYKLHHHEDIYENPDFFDPDNFLPEKSANRHYYSFVPFSAGPRSCVGRKYAMLKLKIMLSTVLRYYKVLPGSHYRNWKLQADVILKRTDGFNVRLEARRQLPKVTLLTS